MKNLNYQNQNGLTRDDVLETLRPHLPDLYESIADGWRAWENLGEREPEIRNPLNQRARACFVYCHITASAKRRFKGVQDVNLSEKGGFLTLTFGREVILRFKKLDAYLRARGARTRQFECFMLQRCLPGFEPVRANIIGGYRLNPLQTQIDDILITCPNGSRNAWYLEIPTDKSEIKDITPTPVEEGPIIRGIRKGKGKIKSG